MVLRKRWLKHGDDPFVIKQDRHDPYRPQIPPEYGLLPTPIGCIIVRPGDWLVIDDAGKRSIETDPAILNDPAFARPAYP